MKSFRYVIQDPATAKTSRGILEMGDRVEVFELLRDCSFRVIRVDEANPAEVYFHKFLDYLNGNRGERIYFFIRQLATLVHSGIPLARALDSLAVQEKNQRFRLVVEAVKTDIERGTPFSEALARYPRYFSRLTVGMVKAGETGGILDEILNRLAQLGLQELDTRSKLQAALTYPIILIGVALLVVGFLLVSAVPKFLDIFQSSQAELPFATTVLLNVSVVLRKYWAFIILGIGGTIIACSRYYATVQGQYFFDGLLLKIPLFGTIYLKMAIAQLTRSLSSLTRSGIPLLEALDVSKTVTGNIVVREKIEEIRNGASQGEDLTELFKKSGIFTPMVIQMVSVGEDSGKFDEMLDEVAQFYDLELEYFLRRLTSSLEPILMLIMGLMVGFIALAVLMPVFNLVKVFRQ